MGIKTVPSKLIYSIDIPEVSNFESKFVYNFYTPDEVTNDTNIFTDYVLEKMNSSQNILSKQTSESFGSENDLKKAPRYIKLSYSPPSGVNFLKQSNFTSDLRKFLKDNFSKIVAEDKFASGYYTSVNVSGGSLDEQVSSLFNGLSKEVKQNGQVDYQNKLPNFIVNSQSLYGESNSEVIGQVTSLQLQKGGTFFKSNVINPYFKRLKTVKFNSQINNNFLYELFLQASGSYHLNNESFASEAQLEFAKKVKTINSNFDLSDDEFKPSIPWYQKESSEGDPTVEIVGYLIEKVELFSDKTIKNHDPIIIEGGSVNGYIDLNVRYGAIYVYKIKTIASVTYNSVGKENLNFFKVKSLVSSKSVIAYAETSEAIAPPPPVEVKYVWDYDRFNPVTATFDHSSNKILPNTGIRGSLLICWSYPINSQMDIKKFQLFRRKSINEPFELIKMFDFNDSIVKFQDLDDMINPTAIENTLPNPVLSFYDDDFMKSSEYIYSLASIDAHGLTSNYSEQFRVRFDSFNNKLTKELVSIAGAPKQYPNMYLEKDLFVDTIKTSSKNVVNVYFTPLCYFIKNDDNSKTKIISNTSPSNQSSVSKYVLNFINIDNQKSRNVEIKLADLTSGKLA